ncbi:MAG: hypothetical protein JOY72_00515 [Actinobacteria bacterium]|nr:hypothetical protein [Actinomycetota bacterium]
MRRLLAWVAGGLAAYRAATHRPAEAPVLEHDPAEELRSKLAQAREAPSPEPEPESVSLEPDDRRRAIHEHGRAALDEMRDET